ncbi:MAG: YgiQ family radical SAM protein [Deltaproteobacteria bacterium]|nr:YgiQ family radical SAM protein [Deltaproteobacteria bacterium]
MFLPTTAAELRDRGWDRPDIVLVTGDTYIDSPFIGAALIGKVLTAAGFRVGIIAQPAVDSGADIGRLGEPRLFWGVTGGSLDSLVANYTAGGRRRRTDDLTPGGRNDRRPDRAVIVYSNLIRRHYKKTVPIVLGGIEASLRRLAHYDYWSNRIRRSILFDAKADYLLYGMADNSVVALARRLQASRSPLDLPGLCYRAARPPAAYLELPAYEEAAADPEAFTAMFHLFYRHQDPVSARGLCQRHGDRFLVHNPPAPYLSQEELDRVHGLAFAREVHPFYRRGGPVRALDTIRFSLASHRGCYGACSFCAIAVHQGQTVRWRSQASLVAEAEELVRHPAFKGIITDVGGPTANMYGFECGQKTSRGVCREKRCLFPAVCNRLPVDHRPQIELLRRLRRVPGVRKVFVASGIRHDLVLADRRWGEAYLRELVTHHISGQLKLAPEHSEPHVLAAMGKPAITSLLAFRDKFFQLTREAGKKQFLTYYFLAAHPGCRAADMRRLRRFAQQQLRLSPRQVQIFTPTPATYATLMYWTGKDPFSGEEIPVARNSRERARQKNILVAGKTTSRR